ncbi:hypothetical protein ACFRJ3_36330 [Streptomyces sp. NPDC056696]|uniref:hypothetical protein n=1 Tax=Streptomyces sp. NPDC056696 TaxID=3345914 RepID=UPI0036B4C7DE
MAQDTPDGIGIDELPAVIRQWAADHDIYLLPALSTAEEQHTVCLEPQDITLGAFCGLAGALGARVLYQDIEEFDADDFTLIPRALADDSGQDPEELLDEDARRGLISVRSQARPHHGRICSVEACFVHNGVAHIWQATAPWHDELAAEWLDFLALKEHAEGERREQEEDPAAEEARQAAMTQQLRDLAEFRSARTATARREIAERLFPDPDDGYHHSWRLRHVLANAHAAVQLDAKAVYEDFENRLDELADELLASALLDHVHGAGPRRIRAADFLTQRSGGYPPPVRTLTLLLGRPQLKAVKVPAQDALPLPH